MQTLAFADEFGTNSFAFDKQTSHFIVCSIIVNEHDLGLLEIEVEEIRRKNFQTGEIKSLKVGQNHQRRKAILEKLCKLNFQIYAVVINKKLLYSDGFKHKASFYKFANGLVYKELYKTFPKLTLAVDEHGGNDFMLSFKKYVQKNHIGDLFEGANFLVENSRSNLMIQVADFMAGTLGYCFDDTKKSSESETFLKLLEPRLSSINHFPNYEKLEEEVNTCDSLFDIRVSEMALRSALSFVRDKQNNDKSHSDQISFVKLLLMYYTTYRKKGFVSTKELINHLDAGRQHKISEQYFRTQIVGKVRDSGVLIASNSSGDKGYKLPTSVDDLYKFIKHSNSIIMPMLKRIKRAKDIISLATHNDLDLLVAYPKLQKIIESF
ncbi:DUF3800 domain-containing protein [Hymenobacter psoromatis]|uniref:DUF3800 domain-containing protein n=1 Tax=Hymenobacter psoromatis TaxID=1484116 RepID=UPI001CC11005|nr:DUF3800 domain-containing protein [Hymenobacter psoromatis]